MHVKILKKKKKTLYRHHHNYHSKIKLGKFIIIAHDNVSITEAKADYSGHEKVSLARETDDTINWYNYKRSVSHSVDKYNINRAIHVQLH